MKKLPIILIYSRVLLGIIIALIASSNLENSGYTIVSLLLLGILIDVFDGVIARKLKVDNERIRILDSNVDMFFWGISLISIFVINMEFVIQNLVLILIVVSYTKFKKTIATHTCLAKALYSLAFKDITNDQTKGNRINNLKQWTRDGY